MNCSSSREWLETDGLGGFASGTECGIRTRRYHALLMAATNPPAGRMVLVNGLDAWIESAGQKFELSSQCYSPGVTAGEGGRRMERFETTPWPHWVFNLEDGTRVEQELFLTKGSPIACISWKIVGPRREAKLSVRPFLSGRDYHCLHKHNPGFEFQPELGPNTVSWEPYAGVPGISALANGQYSHDPLWYYHFQYDEERARGLDYLEDLAAPGILTWNLEQGPAILILTTKQYATKLNHPDLNPVKLYRELRQVEQNRRESFSSQLEAAADQYIVERPVARGMEPYSAGKTIIAGYPWFTDWGRDTFIALRGLCLATGRLDEARRVLLAWSETVSKGMLPNRFPDHGEEPEFNAVDASLWFIIAAYEYLQLTRGAKSHEADREKLGGAMESILEGYSRGTRFGIRLEKDGLLAAGERGVQLTWMDAKVGPWIVTQRAGKPVEVQALWLNALKIASAYSPGWAGLFELGLSSFRRRFRNETNGCLYDVVDVNHRPGEIDPAFRPNQVFAAGGLPFCLLENEQAMRVVSEIEARLWVPLGLRSLAPGEPGYTGHYQGGVHERDGAYHQGTVWPWLLGPFVEAWVRVRGATRDAKRQAREKFLAPLIAHLNEAGLGHISEIADAEPPHTPRGCPFQAWSVGEALRLDRMVLNDAAPIRSRGKSSGKPSKQLVPA